MVNEDFPVSNHPSVRKFCVIALTIPTSMSPLCSPDYSNPKDNVSGCKYPHIIRGKNCGSIQRDEKPAINDKIVKISRDLYRTDNPSSYLLEYINRLT
jgi:hypothetical protein